MKKTYYDLLNEFYDLLQSNPLSSSTQLIYYTLLQINNKCGWIEWFQRTNVNICAMMGISEKTLLKGRNELKQLELIEFVPASRKGQATKYKISNLGCKISDISSTPSSTLNSTPSSRHNKIKEKEEDKEKGGYTSMNEVTPEIVTSKQNVVSLVPYEKMAKILGKPAVETIMIGENDKDINNNIYKELNNKNFFVATKVATEKKKENIKQFAKESDIDLLN